MKKKLRLARLTIAHMTSTDLQRVVGGDTTGGAGTNTTEGVGGGEQSRRVSTKWWPCPVTPGDSVAGDCVIP